MRDMTTLMHEGGHAVHNFLTKDLALGDFKNPHGSGRAGVHVNGVDPGPMEHILSKA